MRTAYEHSRALVIHMHLACAPTVQKRLLHLRRIGLAIDLLSCVMLRQSILKGLGRYITGNTERRSQARPACMHGMTPR